MKTIKPILLALLLVIGCATTIIMINNKNEKETTDGLDDEKNATLKEEYAEYGFLDVETFDESTNGQKKYEKREWIAYETDNEFEFESCSSEEEKIKYTFKVENGVLIITDSNDNIYELQKVKNIKTAMIYSGGFICNNKNLVILTEDGKIYSFSEIAEENYEFNPIDLEDKLVLLATDYLFDKMGYSSYENYTNKSFGATTIDGKSLTINLSSAPSISAPYDEEIYDYLMSLFQSKLIVLRDGMMYFNENEYIKDETERVLYVNYGFISEDKYYIIDRQGILYTLNADGQSNIAIKYSDSKVVNIGIKTDNSDEMIIILEDEEKIEFKSTSSNFGI